MYLAAIAPITAIPRPNSQILTYFTSHKLAVGCLVMVPLFKRQAPGLILKIKDLSQAKSLVKQASYEMRPISYVINPQTVLPSTQIQLALWISQYYWASLGRVLKSFLPDIKKLANINFDLKQPEPPICHSEPECSGGEESRVLPPSVGDGLRSFTTLRGVYPEQQRRVQDDVWELLRTTLLQNKQIIFLVPEIRQIKKWQIDIEQKLNQVPAIFHSRLTPKQYFFNWLQVRNNEAKIILGTRQAILAPAQNLGLIIINDEHSPFYKSYDQKPYLNSRDVALKLAELIDAKIILASATPSIETHRQGKDNVILSVSEESRRYRSDNEILRPRPQNDRLVKIIDLRREIEANNYLLLSHDLQQKINNLLAQKKQILLFINRRGMASALLCRDCGQAINCPNCSVPLIYRAPTGMQPNAFLQCHHCNYQQTAPNFCPHCSSHWLKTLGSGTQKLLTQTQQLFPQTKIAILDKTTAPKPQDEQKILQDWQNHQIDILISTALIFNLESDFITDFIGVVNIDRQLNLPDFHAAERAWQTLKRLQRLLGRHAELVSASSTDAVDSGSEPALSASKVAGMTNTTKSNFVIQTYNPKNYVIQAIAQNNDQLFYRQEIKNRSQFFYPPFSHLVKLTIKHKNNTFAKEQAQILKAKLDRAIIKVSDKIKILGPAPGFIPKIKNQYIWQIILKVDLKLMPKLPILLGIIPKFWLIDIDPENLLS